jgi:3alpha(or 20beta)-hydroxysteroid dehydrogenase
MKLTAPALAKAGGGSIVNISSVAAMKGVTGRVAYGGTKWALRGMTDSGANF